VKNKWDNDLMDACEIDVSKLPRIADCFEPTRQRGDRFDTIYCPIGDGAASNLGSGADQPLVAAINVGTSAAVRTMQAATDAARKPIRYGLFRYVVDSTHWIVGGATSNAGNLRQWCLRELRIDQNDRAIERALSRKAAATDGLSVLPFWAGERAPTWPEGQFGVIEGVTQATTAEQITRCCAIAVFYRLRQILDEMEQSLGRMRRIIVSGGILRSPASLALLADAIGRDVQISAEPEASLRGAAIHALSQLGVKTNTPRSGRTVKHDRALARKHRERSERQMRLEKVMTERRSQSET
jgi:gluconokinase